MRNAVIKTATGSIIATGYTDFTSQLKAGEQQVAVNLGAVEIEGVLLRYQKIVAGEFVEMTVEEKALVEASTPSNRVQSKSAVAELVVAAGGTDATTGFTSAFGGAVTAKPVTAGNWKLSVTFEMALTANAAWGPTGADRAAQARVLWNGGEIATWVHPFMQYSVFSSGVGVVLVEGATPTVDVLIRRLGSAGSARVRRVVVELTPTLAATNL